MAGQVAEAADRVSFGGTGLGIILAGIVLLLVFGSVFAMALPLVSALASLGTAIGVIGLLSHVLKMPQFSTELVLLIGLGVGVDYALFIVTRHRQGLIAGDDVESSIANAVNTSGRAVLFAGIIVCIALLGMFALGVSFLYGLAIAAALGVAFTMIAALTLLPALLGFIGPRVLSRKQKKSLAVNGPRVVGTGTKGFWPKWADFIQRRPVLPAVVALLIVVLVALPFFSLRLGSSDQGNDPVGTTTREAYDLLAQGFGPGFNGPLLAGDPERGPGRHRRHPAPGRPRWAPSPTWPRWSPRSPCPTKDGKTVSLITVYPDSSPQAAATTDLIDHLRTVHHPRRRGGQRRRGLRGWQHRHLRRLRPGALLQAPSLHRPGGGALLPPAGHGLPKHRHSPDRGGDEPPLHRGRLRHPGGGVPVGLAGHRCSRWARPGPVEAFLPVMLFAILFGLSMDYEVFLISRIQEEWLQVR